MAISTLLRSTSAARPAMVALLLSAAAMATIQGARVFLIEQSLCRSHWELLDQSKIRLDGSVPEELCKSTEVQSKLARLTGLYEAFALVPSLFVLAPYTNLAMVWGDKTVLVINACSSTAAVLYFTLVCAFHPYVDIRMILLTGVFDLVGGGQVIQSSLLYSSIGNNCDSAVLSNILYLLSATSLITKFLCTWLGAAILTNHVWLLSSIGVGGYSMFALAVLALPGKLNFSRYTARQDYQALSTDDRDSNDEDGPDHASIASPSTEMDSLPRETIFSDALRAATIHIPQSLALLYEVFTKSPLSRITMTIFLLNVVAMSIRVIFKQWIASMLSWTLAAANMVSGLELIVSGVVLAALPYFSERVVLPWLRSKPFTDLFVAQASLIANISGIIFMGLARTKLTFVAAMTVYTTGSGLADSLRSFATTFCDDEDNVKKLYMGISLAEVVGSVIGSTLWSGLLRAVLPLTGLMKSLPYFVCAGTFLLALAFTYSLKAMYRKTLPIRQELDRVEERRLWDSNST